MSVIPAQSQQRSRPKSTWSFVSNKSGGSRKSSSGSTIKTPEVDLKETSRDKQKTRFGLSQDPTRAISEDEPFAVSQNITNNIRALPHKDQFGNLIVEPDRSNPTRPRWERPLDTIRSFEAAIDNEYKRKSYGRADLYENTNGGGYSRRSSCYAPSNYNTRGLQDGGYYGSRPSPARSESFNEHHNSINSHYQNRPRFGQRVNTEPPASTHHNGQNFYPSAVYQQSVDTVNTASGGSYTTDPWGYSTDPSSEDSSIDRRDQGMKAETADSHGYGVHLGTATRPQFANGLNYPGYSQGGGSYYASNNYADPNGAGYYNQGNSAPPSVPPLLPPKDTIPPRRVPIKLGNTSGNASMDGSKPGAGGKRKSWFKRFSRGN